MADFAAAMRTNESTLIENSLTSWYRREGHEAACCRTLALEEMTSRPRVRMCQAAGAG